MWPDWICVDGIALEHAGDEPVVPECREAPGVRSALYTCISILLVGFVVPGCTNDTPASDDDGTGAVVDAGSGDVDESDTGGDRISDGEGGTDGNDASVIPNVCNKQSCAGCCLEGRCYPGIRDERCGVEGAVCQACGDDEKCLDGTCLAPGCGNGVVEEGEDCDGDAFRKTSCSELEGFEGGELGCTQECTYDTTRCEGNPCVREREKYEEWKDDGSPGEPPFRCQFCAGTRRVECAFCLRDREQDQIVDCAGGGERCFDDSDGLDYSETGGPLCAVGTCGSDDQTHCDEQNRVVHCSEAGDIRLQSIEECTRERPCRELSDGAVGCFDPRVMTCSATSYEPRCDGGDALWCSSGRVRVQPCQTDESCGAPDDSSRAYCFNGTLGTCDPGQDDEGLCDDNRAYACHRTGRWYRRADCDQNEAWTECRFHPQLRTMRCLPPEDP